MYEGREFHILRIQDCYMKTALYGGILHQFAERWWCPVSPFEFYKLYTHCYADRDACSRTEVVSYNNSTGVGADLPIQVDVDGDELQLVVSNKRLFCVSQKLNLPVSKSSRLSWRASSASGLQRYHVSNWFTGFSEQT